MTAVLRGRKHGRHSNLTKLASSVCCELLLAAASQQCVAAVKITSLHSHAHIDAYKMKHTALSIVQRLVLNKLLPHKTVLVNQSTLNPFPLNWGAVGRLNRFCSAVTSHSERGVNRNSPHIDGPLISSEKKKRSDALIVNTAH